MALKKPLVVYTGFSTTNTGIEEIRSNDSIHDSYIPYESCPNFYHVETGSSDHTHLEIQDLNSGDGVGNHTNAFNLLGRPGGQIATGGTSTTETLTLKNNSVDNNSIIISSSVDFGNMNLNNVNNLNTNTIKFNNNINIPPHDEGLLFYDKNNKTLVTYNNQEDISIKLGQEIIRRVNNNTGVLISKGSIVRINSVLEGLPTVELAKADSHLQADQIIGVASHDIEVGGIGNITLFGEVDGLNTSSCGIGCSLYLSATIAGAFTDAKPTYPNYIIKIGYVSLQDISNGKITVHIIGRVENILENAWNGFIVEVIDFTITANDSVITGKLERLGGGELTMNFSDGLNILRSVPPIEVTLIAGTDTNPQVNYIYIPISTKLLTVSISGWPSEEHIKISISLLKTATATKNEGALKNHNWNDYAAGTDNIGHIVHITERLREEFPKWVSGVEATLTIISASAPDDLYISTTSGQIFQLHKHIFPALNMQTGDDIHVVNDSISPYKTVTNLNSELTDALGGTLANKYFSFVIWGIINHTGETSHLMLNLPTGSYFSLSDSEDDVSGYSVYNIPSTLKGVGFLIARFNLKHSPVGGGTWTLNSTQDLRGFLPNSAAGGSSGGGGGVTSFSGLIDTPSSYIGFGKHFTAVNSGETGLEFINENLYALLAGRPGGQTLTGSTLTTETLTLKNNLIDNNSITIGSEVNLGELNIINVGDIIHDNVIVSDFTIKNLDLDKDIIFKINDGGIDTEIIRMQGSTGYIGFGTTNPEYPLHVTRTGGNAGLYLERVDSGTLFKLNVTTALAQIGSVSEHKLNFVVGNAAKMSIDTNGNVGIGITSPSELLDVHGNIAIGLNENRTIEVKRRTTSDYNGNDLTIKAGGATISRSDKYGGNLNLCPGMSTGIGASYISMKKHNRPLTTSLNDNIVNDSLIIPSTINLSNNTFRTLFVLSLENNSMIGGNIFYSFQVTDGTNHQVLTNTLCFAVVRKGASVTKTITPQTAVKALSSGTLTETWQLVENISLSKIEIQAKAISSLSIISMKLNYIFHNASNVEFLGQYNQILITYTPPSGYVAYWRFNTLTGSKIYDESTNNYDLTLTGNINISPGVWNNYGELVEGTGNYLSFSSTLSNFPYENTTIGFFLKNGGQFTIGCGTDWTDSKRRVWVRYNIPGLTGENELFVRWGQGNGAIGSPVGGHEIIVENLTAEWIHVIIETCGTNDDAFRVYVNNVLKATTDDTIDKRTGSEISYIGAMLGGSSIYQGQLMVDEVVIYNKYLTAGERSDLSNFPA